MDRLLEDRIHAMYVDKLDGFRGNMLYGDRSGNVGKGIICSYHSWQFDTDGRCKAIPLDKGYEGTRLTQGHPDCNKTAPRVDSYRGFVFASLAAEGPSLSDWLGPARIAFDDMCDRAPRIAAASAAGQARTSSAIASIGSVIPEGTARRAAGDD